jgi:hypothetical protein
MPLFAKKETIEELEEQNELLKRRVENEDLKLTVAQKQALYQQLKERGLTVENDFGGKVSRAWRWLNKTK